jgi:hypothetical protein
MYKVSCFSIRNVDRTKWEISLNYSKQCGESALILVGWIGICIFENADPDLGGQNDSLKKKKCIALKCWMFSFEGWMLLL